MFGGCSSLSSLPVISKWNTNNVTDIKGKLSGCLSLSILPNISKWNASNVTDMSEIFLGCAKIKYSNEIKLKFRL